MAEEEVWMRKSLGVSKKFYEKKRRKVVEMLQRNVG